MIPLTAEEIHRALTREPESQSVGDLNRAVRDLREMLYQEKIRAQNAEARLAAADVINRPCGKPTHQIRGPAEEDRHLCLECVIEQQREHAAQLAAEVNALTARLAAAETAIEPLRKLAEASVGQRREARKWALLAVAAYDSARGGK